MQQDETQGKLFIVGLIFFLLGIGSVLLYQKYTSVTQADTTTGMDQTEVIDYHPEGTGLITPTLIPSPTTSLATSQSNYSPAVMSSPSGKYTVVESKPITADRLQVETGEQVNFSVAIKNTGVKGKNLTHICFNHSGSVTFGCILDHYLGSGDEFTFGNSMMFKDPGRYTVWITWSQDGNNFYRPVQGSSVTIVVE